MEMTETLLDEMREALVTAHQCEQAGLHSSARAFGNLAARKIEEALAEGWADNDQFQVKGDLVRIPGPDVAETQID